MLAFTSVIKKLSLSFFPDSVHILRLFKRYSEGTGAKKNDVAGCVIKGVPFKTVFENEDEGSRN